ncbi:5,10-methylenetetrahydrofolate reductase [Desulfatibacillum alkenivorans DSM 16219]|jgi:5,10-methylenetetrahydrofolate reductase|uniref:Methylenetetrahydrofolate reductase n=1 Tax=Desulfatibacillum alkenivorans DSM 16219 TaxID=1121393 RepID=A0A1M6DR51_9BACT|nr:methylenetetrahydrofolate reductase [Desulfatibacillum alkenivorans]SHI75653.1 5,10-methylenetetrahydrofolate reductase [Desulfatibacillum alkenivorans DSM 16219]
MQLRDKSEAGQFIVLAEMEPPKGVDVTDFTANAIRVKDQVDAFVVPEMNSAVMRMSSLGASLILQSKGLPTVMQVNCRDRNRLGLQADLLAAGAIGVQNVMAVTGEDPSFGDHHQASAVYDIDLIELLKAVRGMTQGKDMAGVDLAGAPSFYCGSTVNAGVKGKALQLEIDEMKRKIDAGAKFFITPPVFNMSDLSDFMEKAPRAEVKVLPTVLLLKSVGMARYIDRHSDHVSVGDALIKRIMSASDKGRECAQIAADTIQAAKNAGLDGVMIATLGWEHMLPQVLNLKPTEAQDVEQDDPNTSWGKHAGGK